MKKISTDIIINLIVLFVLGLLIIIASDDLIFNFVYIIYTIQFITILYIGYVFYDKNKFFLSPSFIFLLYTNLSFIAGAFLFSLGQDYSHEQISLYFNIKNIKIITFIYVLANSVILLSYKYFDGYIIKNSFVKFGIGKKVLVVGLFGFLLFSNISIDLSFLGGGGEFSLYPQIFFLILIFYYLSNKKVKIRMFLYIVLIAFFASTHYSSKREALSLFFPIIFLESYFGNITIFKNITKTSFITGLMVSVLFLFIVSMSITRGYGGFGVKSYFESFKHVPEYVQSDYFSKVIIANTEVTMTYFHSVDAIDFVINDVNYLMYGLTFFKALFIPIPRSVFPNKPESAIQWYTEISDPLYSLRGGSTPINLVSEFFLNFYFLFFIPLFGFFFYLNKFYLIMIDQFSSGRNNAILLLYGYTFLFALFRGSGTDLLFLAIILILPFYLVLKYII